MNDQEARNSESENTNIPQRPQPNTPPIVPNAPTNPTERPRPNTPSVIPGSEGTQDRPQPNTPTRIPKGL